MIKGNDLYIPNSLKVMKNWCAWKLEQRKDSMTKMPYQTNGKRAKSSDRDTWSSFDNVAKLLATNDRYGYGFMVSDGIVFVDCDHCISNDGVIDDRGADILSAFPASYAEISQSGHGLHILTRGTVPKNFNNRKYGVEMYSSARFCAITGQAIQAQEPAAEQDGVTYVYNRYGKPQKTPSNAVISGKSNNTDRWVITHASGVTGNKGRDFQTLFFAGDISEYGSASEADSALCTLLAFWCDRDPVQIDRLFRQSRLYRAKWEREDYRIKTITHACKHIPESLSEYQRRMNREKASAIAEQCY